MVGAEWNRSGNSSNELLLSYTNEELTCPNVLYRRIKHRSNSRPVQDFLNVRHTCYVTAGVEPAAHANQFRAQDKTTIPR